MPLSNEVVREHAEGLNTLFNAQQAELILALVNAAIVEAAAGVAALNIPSAPTANGDYNLTITSGVATWTTDA